MILGGTAILTLTACGGSGGSQTFASLLAQGDAIADEINTIEFTDPSTLPASGSATYDGFIGIQASNLGEALGEMTLRANFATNAITGDVSNVVTADDEPLIGTLAISNGAIDRSADIAVEYTYGADIDGQLTGEEGVFVVEGDLLGDFTDTDYQYVEGIVEGTVTLDQTTFPIISGGFVGER